MVNFLKMLLKPRRLFKFLATTGTILIVLSVFADEFIHTSTRPILKLGFKMWLIGGFGGLVLSVWFQSWVMSNFTMDKLSKPLSIFKIMTVLGAILFVISLVVDTLLSPAKFFLYFSVALVIFGLIGQLAIKYNRKLKKI